MGHPTSKKKKVIRLEGARGAAWEITASSASISLVSKSGSRSAPQSIQKAAASNAFSRHERIHERRKTRATDRRRADSPRIHKAYERRSGAQRRTLAEAAAVKDKPANTKNSSIMPIAAIALVVLIALAKMYADRSQHPAAANFHVSPSDPSHAEEK